MIKGPIYHAAIKGSRIGAGGMPICGTTGHNRVTVGAAEWNVLTEFQRCERCVAKIRAAKAAK